MSKNSHTIFHAWHDICVAYIAFLIVISRSFGIALDFFWEWLRKITNLIVCRIFTSIKLPIIFNQIHYMITNLLAKLKSPLSNKISIFSMTLPFMVDIKQLWIYGPLALSRWILLWLRNNNFSWSIHLQQYKDYKQLH